MDWGKRALVNSLVWLMFAVYAVLTVTPHLGIAALIGRLRGAGPLEAGQLIAFGVLSVAYCVAVVIVGGFLHPRLHEIADRTI